MKQTGHGLETLIWCIGKIEGAEWRTELRSAYRESGEVLIGDSLSRTHSPVPLSRAKSPLPISSGSHDLNPTDAPSVRSLFAHPEMEPPPVPPPSSLCWTEPDARTGSRRRPLAKHCPSVLSSSLHRI
ncbi:hypothetical protein IEQ34_012752 [Dendrobium chrysotoxum]|uniref:Uncharacterized protein n=1 Tax=Dendrobium chrysotoxum TaxID=161865 RepID=A0AAV7GMC5_DENCH|nr:hypothetical protein IEQ34_012752 [Dendrobium chrysotoxum]